MVKEDFSKLPTPAHLGDDDVFEESSANLEGSPAPMLDKLMNRQGGRNMDLVGGNQSFMGSVRFVGAAVKETVVPTVDFSWLKLVKDGARSTFAFLVTYGFVCGSAIAFLASFSIVQPFWGWGDVIFPALQGKEDISIICYSLAGGIIFLLYILDFWYAIKPVRMLGLFLLVAAIFLLMAAALFSAEDNGAAPLGVFIVVVPVLLAGTKYVMFRHIDPLFYLFAIFCGLLSVSVTVTVLWLLWMVVYDKRWVEDSLEEEYYNFVGCNYTQFVNDQNQTETRPCNQAFLAWASPGLLAAYCFVFANILVIIIRIEARKRLEKMRKKAEPIAQAFLFLFVAGFLVTWITASIFANQFVDISNTVLYFGVITITNAILIAIYTLGRSYMRSFLLKSPLGIKLVEFSDSDWSRAFGVFLLTPVFLVYLMLSFIIQSIRRYTPLGKPLKGSEKRLRFQIESQPLFERLRNWEWGSVLLKVMWIGVFWIIVVIGIGRLVNVFLSWLSGELEGLSLTLTTAVFFGAGMIMFLLPPVPGLPIYFTGGIVLAKTAEDSAGLSFLNAALYSVLICSLLKGAAIVIQQKVIGQIIGARSVYVRSLVNINSLELRAMKKIMAVPGFTIPKVAVLVGGPDWPTSVLTGIMRLPLLQMLLGSVPVVVTIIPVCFAGAVLLKGDEEPYVVLNPILLTLSFIIQLTPFFVAIHYIARAAIVYREELENEPLDEEVEKYNANKVLSQKWSIYLNKWENLSTCTRYMHGIMVTFTVISNLTLWLGGSECFVAFEVTDTIEETLDGSIVNLVKYPFGGIMLLMAAIPWVYLFIFGIIQGQRIKKKISSGAVLPEGADTENSFELFNVSMFSMKNLQNLFREESALDRLEGEDDDSDDEESERA